MIGVVAGTFVDRKRNEYLAKRDAVLRHYVELHPEDFPVTGELVDENYNLMKEHCRDAKTLCIFISLGFSDRKKYGDVLEAWVPIR